MAGQPGNGRRSGVCGGVKTPPHKAIQTPSNPWTGNAATFRGRHAAPAHRPNAVTTQKRYHGADVRGGVKTPPYRVKKTPCQPDSLRVLWRRKPNFRAAAGRGPHSFFIFIFSFLIFLPLLYAKQTPAVLPQRGSVLIQALYALRGITPRSRTAGTSSRRGCARCPAGTGSAARSRCSTQRGCSPCPPSGCPRPCAAAHSG